MKPSQRRAEARSFYRTKPLMWLLNKRARLAIRLLGLEDVCCEKGYPALPRRVMETLKQMTTPSRDIKTEAKEK